MADDSMAIFHDDDLQPDSDGSGRLSQLPRSALSAVCHRARGAHPICFLEEVVEALAGTPSILQVDLKLMRPISDGRCRRLQEALAPLGGNVIVGSQAHWNLRRLEGLPVALDPRLHWHYAPERSTGERLPRAIGHHGLWDDAPIASNPHVPAREYVLSRIEDLRGILPGAREWMVDIATVRRLGELGVVLGDELRTRGVALAAWTLRDATQNRAGVVSEMFNLGVETIITDIPVSAAQCVAAAGV